MGGSNGGGASPRGALTFSDRVLAYVVDQGGTVTDETGRVTATIAKGLGEPEVAHVKQALDNLAQAGFVRRRKEREVEITQDGWAQATNGGPKGVTFRKVERSRVEKAPHRGRRSYGEKVLKAFLESGLEASEVRGLERSARKTKVSIDTYLRKHPELRKQLIVRVEDGALLLARKGDD